MSLWPTAFHDLLWTLLFKTKHEFTMTHVKWGLVRKPSSYFLDMRLLLPASKGWEFVQNIWQPFNLFPSILQVGRARSGRHSGNGNGVLPCDGHHHRRQLFTGGGFHSYDQLHRQRYHILVHVLVSAGWEQTDVYASIRTSMECIKLQFPKPYKASVRNADRQNIHTGVCFCSDTVLCHCYWYL